MNQQAVIREEELKNRVAASFFGKYDCTRIVGNLTNDCVFTYSYDAANRLLSASSNGVVLVANQYDYKGRRIRKTTPTTETTFVYDGWHLIHETVATVTGATTNITEIQYFWGADISETLQGAGGVGGLLAVSCNNNFYFPAYDNNGNVAKYIDESGNIVAAYEYDDFGKTISQSGSLADFFRHRFSTMYFDSETGLYYYGYRFYSPSLMRWLNRDPIEEEGGLNLYGFCGNNSMCKSDNVGLAVVSENLVVVYDLSTGIKAGTILAYTDASAIVNVSCKCRKSKWSLDSVKVDIMTIVHHQKNGCGDNIGASFFAHKSEAEHVNDIKSGVRNLIIPFVVNQELILKLSSYDTRGLCISKNKKVIAEAIGRLLTEMVQESVRNRDDSGSHTWRE